MFAGYAGVDGPHRVSRNLKRSRVGNRTPLRKSCAGNPLYPTAPHRSTRFPVSLQLCFTPLRALGSYIAQQGCFDPPLRPRYRLRDCPTGPPSSTIYGKAWFELEQSNPGICPPGTSGMAVQAPTSACPSCVIHGPRVLRVPQVPKWYIFVTLGTPQQHAIETPTHMTEEVESLTRRYRRRYVRPQAIALAVPSASTMPQLMDNPSCRCAKGGQT